jgi:uncharacterized protein (DUF302 family)
MAYYIARTVSGGFDETVAKVVDGLKQEGFGVLTEIDVSSTLKQKLNVDLRKYRILGACNPPLAYRALTAEDKIGVMLPCNVIVQEAGEGRIGVAAIDPTAAMDQVGNPALAEIAHSVAEKLTRVLEGLSNSAGRRAG